MAAGAGTLAQTRSFFIALGGAPAASAGPESPGGDPACHLDEVSRLAEASAVYEAWLAAALPALEAHFARALAEGVLPLVPFSREPSGPQRSERLVLGPDALGGGARAEVGLVLGAPVEPAALERFVEGIRAILCAHRPGGATLESAPP